MNWLPNTYIKILFLGQIGFHLGLLISMFYGPELDQLVTFKNILFVVMTFGFLTLLATLFETLIEEGFLSAFLTFFSLTIPILGSYFLFSFLIKEIRKENKIANGI